MLKGSPQNADQARTSLKRTDPEGGSASLDWIPAVPTKSE